jgi:hypothetical protein
MNKNYPILLKWKLLFVAAFSFFCILLLNGISYISLKDYDPVSYFIGAAIVSLFYLRSINVILFIFEDGLQYRRRRTLVEVKWSELTKIEEKRFFYFWKQSGIFVSNPTKNQVEVSATMKWFYSPENLVITKNQSVFIPLSWFADNWRDSELGKQIKQRAPHLFK